MSEGTPERSLDAAALATLRANSETVRRRVADAFERSGRRGPVPGIVAVTKGVGPSLTAALADLGFHALGENRPLDALAKAKAVGRTDIRWHLIGRYQTNKIRKTLPLFDLIHSVDSLHLLEAIAAEASRIGRRIPVFFEVNVSGERTKQGFDAEGAAAAVLAWRQSAVLVRWTEVRGLMTMAPVTAREPEQRRHFGAVRELLDRLHQGGLPTSAAELSMGMSQDFEAAILEGATVVRIGTLFFEGLTLGR
jgi:hypothetical protein